MLKPVLCNKNVDGNSLSHADIFITSYYSVQFTGSYRSTCLITDTVGLSRSDQESNINHVPISIVTTITIASEMDNRKTFFDINSTTCTQSVT